MTVFACARSVRHLLKLTVSRYDIYACVENVDFILFCGKAMLVNLAYCYLAEWGCS